LGDDRDRDVDVRIVAATNRDLHTLRCATGSFREDLYYRLATITVTLPPLRERKSDIAKIAERLLEQLNRQFAAEQPGFEHKSLSAAAKAFLKRHDWPGNVRQLHNALIQAAVLADQHELTRSDLEAALGQLPAGGGESLTPLDHPLGEGFDLIERLKEIQRHYLRRAMNEAHGVKAEAARLLGLKHYQTLAHQLRQLGLADRWGDQTG
jgi:DNA-binding NtrC family response regulator